MQRPGEGLTAAETVSSLPAASANLPPTVPSPDNRNGVYSCGAASSGVTTNFVNPRYPATDSGTGSCKFYLVVHSDVCQVRLLELIRTH